MSRSIGSTAHASPEFCCPACGERCGQLVFTVVTDRQYEIRRCAECGMAAAFPRPTPAELHAFYEIGYFARDHQHVTFGYRDYVAAEYNARRMWKEIAAAPWFWGTSPRTVLDVGCGTGGFLHEAKAAGWEGLGLEFSTEACQRARSEFGLRVLQTDIFAEGLTLNSFGLVTLWHVLEHTLEPLAVLARCKQLLSPLGRVVIELPNWDSLGRVVKKTRWSQMKPPEHINFFNAESLKLTVKSADLRVLSCETLYPSMQDEARVHGILQPFRIAKAAVASACCKLGRGGYLRVIATHS